MLTERAPTELTVAPPRHASPAAIDPILATPSAQELADLREIANTLSLSTFFDQASSPEVAQAQALVKILIGRELRIPAVAAMTAIQVFQSKGKQRIVIEGRMLLALIQRAGGDWRDEHSEDGCRITWYRNGHEKGVTKFTTEDARSAGLATKDTYKQFGEDMYFWRAVARGQRRYFPDVTFGASIYVQGELEEGDDSSSDDKTQHEPGGYAVTRNLPLTPVDFSPEEKIVAMRLIRQELVNSGAIKPGTGPTKAMVLMFLERWHPKTKAELLEAAANLAPAEVEIDAEEKQAEEPAPETTAEEPAPEPEKRKAAPKRQSLFGNR